MAKHQKVAVALVGGGSIAPFHAKYLQASPTCELVAIIDPFLPGKTLAQDLSVAHFNSVAELVSSSSDSIKPDLYYICVPSGLHVQLASDVLTTAQPKAILVEKPLSTDSASGETVLSLAASRGCKVAVGHHRRFHPTIRAAKKVISSGRVGQITAISGVWTCKKNDGYFTLAPWRASRTAGGGPVWTNFVHDIDLLHYLVDAHVDRVWATRSISRRKLDGVKEGDTVEEGAAIMLRFANGVVGTFVLSDNVPSPYGWESATGENPLYPRAEGAVDCYRVFGTQGTLTVPDGNLWTYSQQDATEKGLEVGWHLPLRREVVEVLDADAAPFQLQAEHLARLVRGEEEPLCSGRDGLAAVKVCEAIVAALDRNDGLPVDIEQV